MEDTYASPIMDAQEVNDAIGVTEQARPKVLRRSQERQRLLHELTRSTAWTGLQVPNTTRDYSQDGIKGSSTKYRRRTVSSSTRKWARIMDSIHGGYGTRTKNAEHAFRYR